MNNNPNGDNGQSDGRPSEPPAPGRDGVQETQIADQSNQPSGDEPQGDSKPFWRDLNIREWIMACATVAAAFAAVASGFIAWWTYGELDKQRVAMEGQLQEMQSGAQDTKNLVTATQHLADAGAQQATAMNELANAGESQAANMDKLRIAGEGQEKAAEHLADAGRSQAVSTHNLAENSARQLGAIQASADAAKIQAAAVQKQSDATVIASKATDRLADAGQAQSKAVLQTLDVARAANDIASRTALAADRAWVSVGLPGEAEPSAGQDYKLQVDVSNVGRSPAINVIGNVQFKIIRSNETFPLIGKCQSACEANTVFPSSSAFQVAPVSFHPSIAAANFTADEMKRLADRTDTILLQVRVDYTDTSGNPHFTEACGSLIPKFGFATCSDGNYAN